MPVCPKCKRQYNAAPPIMLPKCPACGYDPARAAAPSPFGAPASPAAPSLATQLDRGLRATDVARNDPLAKEILGFADQESDVGQKRIKRTLEIALLVHTNADFLAGLVKAAAVPDRPQVVKDLDVELRKRDPSGQEILGFAQYDRYARDPDSLRTHLREAWDKVKTRWELMGVHKRKYVYEVFEHDKGYPQTKASAVNWLPPSQDAMKRILAAWLGEVRNSDIFTSFSIGTPMRTSDNISKGWNLSVVDKKKAVRKNSDPAQAQYKAMWAEVVNVIAKAIDTFDQDKVHAAIKTERDAITAQMSALVPKPAVTDFIDRHFDAVWDHLLDPPQTTLNAEDNKDYRTRLTSFG